MNVLAHIVVCRTVWHYSYYHFVH